MINKSALKFKELSELYSYGPLIFDANCDEPIAWGFHIKKHLGEKQFALLSLFGQIQYLNFGWVLILKRLSFEEAIRKYGSITNQEFDSNWEWRSITFGNKKFTSRELISDL